MHRHFILSSLSLDIITNIIILCLAHRLGVLWLGALKGRAGEGVGGGGAPTNHELPNQHQLFYISK
jgi:hypothetical protein